MRTIVRAVVAIFLIAQVCSAQDGLKGLKDYLKQYKYNLFVPPRQNVVLDTVVNYDAGYESVVTTKCIPADKVPPSVPSAVALTARTGNVSRTLGLEGGFAHALDPDINVSGAYSDSRVQKVVVEIADPRETHIESKDLKDFIATLNAADSCAKIMVNKKNRVLESLLLISGVKYTFYDKSGKNLKLDLALLKAIKLAPKYQKDYENTDSLDVKVPIVIGYRAWKVREIPGAVRNLVVLEESDPAEIERLKRAAGSESKLKKRL